MIQTGIFSAVFCSIILLYACYSDYTTRSVANKLWLLMIAVGIPLAIYNFFLFGMPFLTRFGSSVLFTFLLAYTFFKLGLFGGADAKSLIALAVLIPTNPLNTSLILDPFPFAITTLFNAAVISLIAPISMFFYNLWSLRLAGVRENLSLAFIGYKMPIDAFATGKHEHVLLLHSYEEAEDAEDAEEGVIKRKFIFGGIEQDDGMIEQLKDFRAQGKIEEDVWITPGLPYMLFITSGFFIALFYGNLPLQIISSLFSP